METNKYRHFSLEVTADVNILNCGNSFFLLDSRYIALPESSLRSIASSIMKTSLFKGG